MRILISLYSDLQYNKITKYTALLRNGLVTNISRWPFGYTYMCIKFYFAASWKKDCKSGHWSTFQQCKITRESRSRWNRWNWDWSPFTLSIIQIYLLTFISTAPTNDNVGAWELLENIVNSVWWSLQINTNTN